MNDADSKKLEESEELRERFVLGWALDAQMLSTWDWLISKVKEQDGEIAELREINAGDIRTYQQLQSNWKTQQDKAETELIQLRKYNDVLQSQRAAVYNEGVEDGKRKAEKLLAEKEKG